MKSIIKLLFFVVLIAAVLPIYSQEYSFEGLIIQKELNPIFYIEAKREAIKQALPISIKLKEGTLIDVLKTEDGKLLYSVIKNVLNPSDGAEVLTYDQILNKYSLSDAQINWGNASSENQQTDASDTKLILIPDWTNDNVISFDPVTGNLINVNFIPPNPGNLASPKHALLNPAGFISVSDQVTDLVQKFDTAGAYLGIYAPAGGVNNAILDNLRGHGYRPNGNLVVTVGSGANTNGIPQFDDSGNYLGNFIAIGAGGLNSPFDILFRTDDVLVTGSSSNAAHRYDLNGNYLNNLITGVNFPQDIYELPNGNLAVAGFSSPSGLRIYTPNGNLLHYFNTVASLRSVYLLPGGTYLVTNNGGLHEIDSTNGTLIRTIYTSSNLQYISYVDYSIIPVELTSFTAAVSGNSVELNWTTATELNNSGFEIERREAEDRNLESEWTYIGFVNGSGTTSESHSYSFIDNLAFTNNQTLQYRLKQIDFDGSFNYSQVVEVNILKPDKFSLEQNYPNPFNPSTTISFNIPTDGLVSLKVFDIMGNQVAELLNKETTAGFYSIKFDASQLASGTYFYKLQSGSNVEVQKMLLLK
ncbi:MAG: T9SS type A sorting domain-containing protein [Ignavibacteriaceae bacterium]|jgi:hypothetical protein|nr:T9SS type A sorting domain-containing protein [Ignavibacteriaceae bacterium]